MIRKFIFQIVIVLSFMISFTSWADNKEMANFYFEKAKELDFTTEGLFLKEQYYKKVIELLPDCAAAYNNLGDVYEKQGRYEEAIDLYKKANQLSPKSPEPCFGLGDIYFSMGKYQEAKEWYTKGLKYAPNDKLTQERMKLLKDMEGSGIIKRETIRKILTPSSSTRQVGKVVSLTFGEVLIPFDFDRYDIREDAKPQLNELGMALRDKLGLTKDIDIEPLDNSYVIEIAGHTDIRGTDEYNLILSQKRANAVVDYLVRNFGLPRDRFEPKGYGKRVLLSTGTTEADHALNRRVEVTLKQKSDKRGTTRSFSYRDSSLQKLNMEIGVFYMKDGSKKVQIIEDEKSRLKSNLDKYFIFFRPLQDCYVYILQEDSTNKVELLYPKYGSDGKVEKSKDYWIPSFGKAYILDDTKGKEKIHIVVTSWSLKSQIEGFSLEEQVCRAIRGLGTRYIKVVKPPTPPEEIIISFEQGAEQQQVLMYQRISSLLEKIEGDGGWVKTINFWHE